MNSQKELIGNIPPQLKNQLIWVLWRSDPSRGKPTKVPYQPSGRKARCNDSETWASFTEVYQAYTRSLSNGRPYDGIGIMLGCEIQGRTLVGIDLDSCRYDDGTLTAEASLIIERVDSYAEVSPSGTGVKILALLDAPIGAPVEYSGTDLIQASPNKNPEFAYYETKRYFCLTGDVLDGYSQLRPSHEVVNVVSEYKRRKDAAKATKTHAAASEPATTTTAADEFAERQRAALYAIGKIPVGTNENDGSSRLLNYCRQAKRFMRNEGDCLRLVKQGIARFQFPSQWTDEEILQRIADADVNYGQDFKPSQIVPSGKRFDICVKARRMDQVQAESINWWWPGKIPRANLIIFAGQGGCGKSSVCCDLIARHTTGKPFPNSDEYRNPENVAIINCEDDAATIQRPRLDAAGADCSRVHLLDNLEVAGGEAWIDFNMYSAAVEQYIIDHSITLLVIDPISGHIGGKKQNDTAEVREVLQRIQAIAKRTGCAIICITHSPKAATSAQSAVIGSQAFVSCARAAFAFVVDKEDPKLRYMLNAKNNYSADETGFSYYIEDCNGVGIVRWNSDPVTEHPNSFFLPDTKEGKRTREVDKVASSLAAFLTEPKPKKEIDEWAKANQITGATLRRAKEKNGHEAEKRIDGWYWLPLPFSNLGQAWKP